MPNGIGEAMKNRGIEKPYNARSPLREKLVIIEALVFLLPVLVVAYIYYQKKSHLIPHRYLSCLRCYVSFWVGC